jgi:hypothetical protein
MDLSLKSFILLIVASSASCGRFHDANYHHVIKDQNSELLPEDYRIPTKFHCIIHNK